MIYELGKMHVARTSVDTESFNDHIVLTVPILKFEEMYPVYDLYQTGIKEGNVCLKLSIPERVYLNETFYSYKSTVFLSFEREKEVLSGEQLVRGVDSPVMSMKVDIGNTTMWKVLMSEGKAEMKKYNISKLDESIRRQEDTVKKIENISTTTSNSLWRAFGITVGMSVITTLLTQWAI